MVDINLIGTVAVGIAGFFVMQRLITHFIMHKSWSKKVNQELHDVLNKPEYRVKGRFE